MRKSLLILLQIIVFALPAFASHVDEKTAQKVAEIFLKSKMQVKTDFKLNQIAYANRANFSNFYVFGGENCFVIVSADDCVQPILGYSDKNPFGTEAMPENVHGWLEDYDAQIQFAIDNKLVASEEIRSEWQSLRNEMVPMARDVVVGPLVETYWDQGSPYNALCPKDGETPTYTGCVATAMSQIMKYWNYPTQGAGSFGYEHPIFGELYVNFGETTYRWDDMPSSLDDQSPSEQIDAVATLMYHCGVAAVTNYGTDGSSANASSVPVAMIDNFRYAPSATLKSRTGYTDEEWNGLLRSELDEGRVMFYSGKDLQIGGHGFVCDGYRDDDYFHFNWGWGGDCDGYYSANHLEPNHSGAGIDNICYNNDNSIVVHLEPLSSI